MFNRLFKRYVLMEEASAEGAGGGGGGAAAPAGASAAAPAAPAPAESGAAPTAAGAKPGAVEGMPKSALSSAESPDGDAAAAAKPDGEKQSAEEGAKPAVEPVKYEDFKFPDGVKLDAEKLAQFTDLAGGASISQEVAQQFIDLYTANVTEAVSSARQQAIDSQVKGWNDLNQQWLEQAKSDPVIGGQDFDKKLGQIKTALNTVLGKDAPEFFEAMNVYGSGTNHPTILRGLYKALQVHMPAAPVSGNGPSSSTKSAGATLYPTQVGLGNGHQG